MFPCEPLESSKQIGGDISDEPVTHCFDFFYNQYSNRKVLVLRLCSSLI